jgi:hypothetical protein
MDADEKANVVLGKDVLGHIRKAARKFAKNKQKKDPIYILLRDFCHTVLTHPKFEKVYEKQFSDVKSSEKEKIFEIMIDCAIELFDEIVKNQTIVKGEIVKNQKIVKDEIKTKFNIKTKEIEWNSEILKNKLAFYCITTCLIIALKTYGAYDWIIDGEIKQAIGNTLKLDPEILFYLVYYILKMTEWEGCDSYKLGYDYDDDFKVENDGQFDHLTDPKIYKSIKEDMLKLSRYDTEIEATVKGYISQNPDKFTKKQIEDYDKNKENSKIFKIMENEVIKSKLFEIGVFNFVEDLISDPSTMPPKDKVDDYKKNGKKSALFKSCAAYLLHQRKLVSTSKQMSPESPWPSPPPASKQMTKSPPPKSKKMSKSPSPSKSKKMSKKSPSPKSPSPKSPKSPKKSPSKSAFKKKRVYN